MATAKQILTGKENNEKIYFSLNSRHYELVTVLEVGKELTKFQTENGKIQTAFHKYIKLDDSAKHVKKDKKRTFLSVSK